MTCVGSLIIIAMSLNILGITKIKLMNYIPVNVFTDCCMYVYVIKM